MKSYPALDVRGDSIDLALAAVDDFSPTAAEERDGSARVFFATLDTRDAARRELAARGFDAIPLEVPDDDWARRSQAPLGPITVGRITIVANPESPIPNPGSIVIVIAPSMGFGTGHHATTRLCLDALQTIDLAGASVLDVGTGSGVLAIAAERLGAARAVGIDHDPDAIQSARENLTRNPGVQRVEFVEADLGSYPPVGAGARPDGVDVLLANLTGALLVRSAERLQRAIRPGGVLILSGLQTHERDEVVAAFPRSTLLWERHEDGWIGLVIKKPSPLNPGPEIQV